MSFLFHCMLAGRSSDFKKAPTYPSKSSKIFFFLSIFSVNGNLCLSYAAKFHFMYFFQDAMHDSFKYTNIYPEYINNKMWCAVEVYIREKVLKDFQEVRIYVVPAFKPRDSDRIVTYPVSILKSERKKQNHSSEHFKKQQGKQSHSTIIVFHYISSRLTFMRSILFYDVYRFIIRQLVFCHYLVLYKFM